MQYYLTTVVFQFSLVERVYPTLNRLSYYCGIRLLVIFPQSKTDANEDNANLYSNVDSKVVIYTENRTAYTTSWTDVYISLILFKGNRLLYGIVQ